MWMLITRAFYMGALGRSSALLHPSHIRVSTVLLQGHIVHRACRRPPHSPGRNYSFVCPLVTPSIRIVSEEPVRLTDEGLGDRTVTRL